MTTERMPRLVYLAAKLERDAVRMPRDIKRLVPNFDLYEEVAKNGLHGAAEALEIPRAQMNKLHAMGRDGGKGNLAEFRLLIAKEVMDSPTIDDLPVPRRLSLISLLDRYVNNVADIIETEEIPMNTKDIPPDIPKWKTGFTPLDQVLGDGVYQGILMLMLRPGEGKTSLCLSIMEAIKKNNPTWQMFFFEQEIPQRLMLARAGPIFRRTQFHQDDYLICGQLTIEDIIRRLERKRKDGKKHPPRVVIIDSPDAMPGLDGENTTRQLGHIFRQLVKIKESAELVIVTTQPNRREEGKLKKTSPANSWEKVWYVDMMVAGYKLGNTMGLQCLKNRFGEEGRELQFQYNATDMTYDAHLIQELTEDDWSDVED